MVEKQQRCPRCGTHPDEREDLIAEAYRCLSCEKIDIEKDSWAEGGNVRGLSIGLYPKGTSRTPPGA